MYRDQGGYGQEKKAPKVYVSNLNYLTTEEELRKQFSPFGQIVEVILKRKEPVVFAFIEFQSVKDAEKAIDSMPHFTLEMTQLSMNRKTVNGNEIKVQFAKGERKKFGDSRGGYGGDRGSYGGDRGGNRYGGEQRSFQDRPRGCFNCGEEGHMARDCDKPRKPREFNNDRGGFRGGYRGGDRDNDRGYERRDNRDNRDDDRDKKKRKPSGSGSRSRSRSGDKKRKAQRKRRSSSSSRS